MPDTFNETPTTDINRSWFSNARIMYHSGLSGLFDSPSQVDPQATFTYLGTSSVGELMPNDKFSICATDTDDAHLSVTNRYPESNENIRLPKSDMLSLLDNGMLHVNEPE